MWRQGTVIQSNLDWAERFDCAPFFVRLDEGICKLFYGTNIRACDKSLEKLGVSDDDSLFETPPPMPDCPICFLPLPIEDDAYSNKACCGATICRGCEEAHWNTDGLEETCPFCRAPERRPMDETIRLMKKRVELNDAENMFWLGCFYAEGKHGLAEDHHKAHELFIRAADLGSPRACTNASTEFETGEVVKKDEEKLMYYLEKGAKLGQVKARYNLGDIAASKGEWDIALRHMKISASSGYQPALDRLKDSYKQGMLCKEELAKCLRAQQKTLSEAWSKDREKVATTKLSKMIQSP